MSPLPVRTLAALAPLGYLLVVPLPTAAQSVGGHSLQGDWVRVDSNYDPYDQMRIVLGTTGGVLTFIPAAATSSWKIGDVLWRGIQGNGSLHVMGNDGSYYPATMKLNGPDEIHLTIHHPAAGDDQMWRRAGPDINGDWVLVGPLGAPGAGTRIQVQGPEATVDYLAASAPRVLRVGRKLWQQIGPSGLQVLGSDNQYHPATWTLVAPDRIQVDATQIAGGRGQIWVRPASVAAAQASLQPPSANPGGPGSNLTPPSNLPGSGVPGPFPAPPPANATCLSTSLPHDQIGLDWGLQMFSLSRNGALHERMGITPYMSGTRFASSGAGGAVPTELELLRLTNIQPGYAYLWDWRSSRGRGLNTWEMQTDLPTAVLDQEIQRQEAAGNRPADVEAHASGSSIAYGVIWEPNTERLDWLVRYDLDAQAFASAVQNARNNGYRLVDFEVAQGSGGPRYVGLWYTSCDNTNWKAEFDLDRMAYQARVDAETTQGFQVIDFESYYTPAGQRYSAIWQRVTPARDWAVRSDRDLKWFLNYHNEYVDLGMRLIDFESYSTADGLRYSGVWAENDDRYDHPFRTDLDQEIEDYRGRHGIPGITVVVMLADEVIYRRGFGWADSVEQKRAHSGTVYLTASVAKAIAATLTARLAERGHLNLDDRTRDHIPNLSTQSPTHTHTIEQLLSKTGCVRHYDEVTSAGQPDLSRTYVWRIDVVEQLWNDPILRHCQPGQHYRYSTHGFTYVGAVLEAVMGEPIADILANELTNPFQLYSMRTVMTEDFGGYGGLGVKPYDLTQGYKRDPNNWRRNVETDFENTTWKVLGGGLQTNALDLARFGWLTLNGTIVSTTTRDDELWRVRTNGVTNWFDLSSEPTPTALAWVIARRPPWLVDASGQPLRNAQGQLIGRFAAEHRGNALTATSYLRIYRDEELTIAILDNQREDLSTQPPANGDPADHPVSDLADQIAIIVMMSLGIN